MFFIIIGQRGTRKKLGRVAEYCPYCRKIRAVSVLLDCQVNHLFFIPADVVEMHGYVGRCKTCKGEFFIESPSFLKPIRFLPLSLETLIEKTNPHITQHPHIITTEEAYGNPYSSQREKILEEILCNTYASSEYQHTRGRYIDRETLGAILSTVILPNVILSMTPSANILYLDAIGLNIAAFITLLLLIVFTLKVFKKRNDRYINQRIYPQFIHSLTPLSPTTNELEPLIKRFEKNSVLDKQLLHANNIVKDVENHGKNIHDL